MAVGPAICRYSLALLKSNQGYRVNLSKGDTIIHHQTWESQVTVLTGSNVLAHEDKHEQKN